jgi:predicted 3-demethylubiquinone-9 3-methyltransferase (glyoxalase superfamily)
VEFTVLGIPCIGLNGGPYFKQQRLFLPGRDGQSGRDGPLLERDRRQWRPGKPVRWCKDRWGLSWQITPRVLTDALAAGGAEAKRAFEAMMPMKKIDIATIEAARRG